MRRSYTHGIGWPTWHKMPSNWIYSVLASVGLYYLVLTHPLFLILQLDGSFLLSSAPSNCRCVYWAVRQVPEVTLFSFSDDLYLSCNLAVVGLLAYPNRYHPHRCRTLPDLCLLVRSAAYLPPSLLAGSSPYPPYYWWVFCITTERADQGIGGGKRKDSAATTMSIHQTGSSMNFLPPPPTHNCVWFLLFSSYYMCSEGIKQRKYQ